ncbi:MAG: hypothetical protein A2Z66_02360 [Chloroflexi bacterium RBG_13_66_10]|nr:MAG: hypothetical protein A2Z66_02360 [Chloroflexi bacterium RBG_13_66_10]
MREGIVKHETEYDVSDAAEYEPEKRGHLEAQIANAADELAYTAHDLDDGLRSSLITPRQLHDIALFQRLLESVGLEESDIDDLARHRLIRRLIGIEVTDLIEATDHRIVESGAGSVEALQLLSHNVIGFSDQLEAMNRQLKDFLYQNMYQHHRVVRMHMKAEQILEDLFRAYTERPDILSQEVRERAQEGDLHRTVCDYVAGMTDRFAETEHAKLFQPGERP